MMCAGSGDLGQKVHIPEVPDNWRWWGYSNICEWQQGGIHADMGQDQGRVKLLLHLLLTIISALTTVALAGRI